MNFSELVPYHTAAFSHSGDAIAIAKDRDLFVYDSERLSINHRFQIQSEIQKLRWSPDDSFLMCINTQRSVVHLRTTNTRAISCDLEGWTGQIEDDMLVGAIWTPCSRQIITFTDMQLRATVWSLVDGQATAQIKGPKFNGSKGVDWSSNGKFMAMVERRDSKDWISIYYAGLDFKLTNSFEVGQETFDAQDCKWTMKNTAILVQDNSIESKYVLYAAMTGQPLAVHQPDCRGGLGIRTLSISPSSQIVACGMYDTNLCLYNNLTQRPLCELEHITSIQTSHQQTTHQTVVFREQISKDQYAPNGYLSYSYENLSANNNASQVKVPGSSKKDVQSFMSSTYEQKGLQGPPTGTSLSDWSFDSHFLATKCESQPTAVYVWDVTTLSLHTVLIHENIVRSFKFAPHSHQLLIGTGQQRIFLWTPNGSCVVQLPQQRDVASGLHVQKLLWNPRGTNLLLSDKTTAMLAFPSAELLSGGIEVKPMAAKVTNHTILSTDNSSIKH